MQGNSMGSGYTGNRKTGLILAAIALGFFFAIMLRYWLAK
jgi:hypothetical protein